MGNTQFQSEPQWNVCFVIFRCEVYFLLLCYAKESKSCGTVCYVSQDKKYLSNSMPFLTFDARTFIGVAGSRAFGRVKESVIGFKYMIINMM